MKWHRIAVVLSVITLASLAAAQVVPQRVRVSPGVMQGLLVKKVQPEYPGDAKQIQGSVVLKTIIDKEGNVASLQVMSGHPLLVPAAIEAVKQWKYRPYLLNGSPIEVETQVTVNFTLADEPAKGVVGSMPGGIPPNEQGGIVSNAPIDAGSAVPQRVRVSSGVMQGLVVSKVPPHYPADARDQHIQGAVILQAVIGKKGNVESLQLISGHPMLAPAAIEAVKQWKYHPYLLNSMPVEVETQIQVNFTLAN